MLRKPIVSEKSNDAREENKYTFAIPKRATKKDVERAIAKLFDVKVQHVNTVSTRGKIKRRGLQLSRPQLRKKAIVTLRSGEKLPLFEEQ